MAPVFFYAVLADDLEALGCFAVFFTAETLGSFLVLGVAASFLTTFAAGLAGEDFFFGAFLICFVLAAVFLTAAFLMGFGVYLAFETDFSLFAVTFGS